MGRERGSIRERQALELVGGLAQTPLVDVADHERRGAFLRAAHGRGEPDACTGCRRCSTICPDAAIDIERTDEAAGPETPPPPVKGNE